MNKLGKTFFLLTAGALAGLLALAPALAQDDTVEDRKARILANLKLAYPQLGKLNLVMGVVGPSEYSGLDEGTFSVNGRQQSFFVSKDDKKLFLINGNPIDASRSQEEIQAEIAKREEVKAAEAAGRRQELEDAVAGRPLRGNPDAPITIVEFSDFQCPYCKKGADTMEALVDKYPNDVRFVFQHFPLGFHPWAKPASIASHCAGLQDHDAFWTLHDKFFDNQKVLNPGNVLAKSKEYLAASGIDMATWSTCAEDKDSEEYKAASAVVDADTALGKKHGVSGTPGFFVNGQFLNGAQPISAFEPLIQAAKSDS
ncbi:MAG: thioredoxin domain-containing protein [Thermoanaerobaculia bacterium]